MLPQQPKYSFARSIQNRNQGQRALRENGHSRSDPDGDSLGVVQSDLLGNQLANDERCIGYSRYHSADAHRVRNVFGQSEARQPAR
jgi:hypothetical protein